MAKNRKKTDTYRFNGNPSLQARSIHPVTMAELELWIVDWEAKLADPNDPNDKKWTERWLKRFRMELAKKRRGRGMKQSERLKVRRTE
jgi:hypothetical protein